jgi:hypothetical protein
VGTAFGLGKIMGANNHTCSLNGQASNAPPDLVPRRSIETSRRFIEKN